MHAETPILEARGLCKEFRLGGHMLTRRRSDVLRAVVDVDCSLRPGVVTALVGESGSGKSTLLRLLVGLAAPTSGRILFGSEDVSRLRGRRAFRRYRASVQMIFQDPFGSLNPVKTVAHHVARPLRIHRIVPRSAVNARVLELLESVGLVPAAEIAAKFPHELSGGQRQRVAIARALAVEPAVLLADEPISMLDVSIRIGVLNLIRELKQRRRLAILYVTHDLASARYVADEVLVMYAGEIVERGSIDDVLQNPLHAYTQLLISAAPNPDAVARADALHASAGRGGTPHGRGALTLGVRGNSAALGVATGALVEVRPGHFVRTAGVPPGVEAGEGDDR